MKKSLRITSSIIVLALIISLIMPSISGAFYSLPDDNQSDELISPGAEYNDGEIIVGFIKNEQSEDDKEESDAETLMETQDSGKDIDICVVDTNGKSVEDAIREYKKKPNVAFAEPNYKVEDNAESPDYTQYEYYPTDVTGGMNVPDWNTDTAARSDGAVVAVIDTGIDYTHEDLQDVMWNEGLNYPSLVEMGGGAHGFNSGAYAEGDKEHTDDPCPPEDLDHGTHVAGIVAASWNDYGVSGVTNGSKIMAIRTVGSDGRIRLGSVVAAIDYVCKAKDAGVNVVVANNSWALKYLSHAIVCAVKEADKRGIICVFGSGNEIANLDRTDSTIYMLRQLPNVIVVNASDSKGTRACFSNYGQYTTDIFAPGTDMLSTVPSSDRYADARLSTPVIKNDFESDSNLKVESYDFDGNVMPHTWTDNKGYNDSNGYIKTNDDGRDTIITCTEDLSVKRPQYLTFMMEKERIYNKDEVDVFYNRTDGEEGFVSDKGICENGRWSSVSIKLPDDFDYENFEIKLEFPVYQHDKTHDDPDNTVRIDNVMLTSDAWSYYRMSGTSMAAPVVTGEVATIATQYPMESSEKIVARTLGSAAKNDNLTNMCVIGGVANLNNALNENYSPVVQNAKFRGNQLVVDGYFFKDKGQLYIDDNPVNVISWSDNEIVASAEGIDSSKSFVKVEVKNNNIDGFDRGSRYIPLEENRTDFVDVDIPEAMDKMAHVNQSAVSLGDCIYFATADYMNMNIFITEYNTKTGEWYEVTRDSTYRLQSGQLVVYKGKIIIIAGVKNGDKYETRLLEYDPSTRSITYEDIDNIEMPYSPTLVNYKGEILVLAKGKRSDSGIESNDVIYKIDFDNKKLIEAGESSNLPGSMSIPFYDTLGNVYIGFSEQSNTVSKVVKKDDNTFDIEVIEENLLPTPIVDPNTQRPEYSLAFSKEGIITTASDTFSDSGEVLRDTYLGSIGEDGKITFSNTGKLYNSTMSIRPMSVVNGNRYYVIASYYGSKAHGKTLRYLEGYNELVPEGFLSDQRSDSNNDHSTPVSRNDTDDRVTIKVPKVPKTGDNKGRVIEEITSRQQLNNPDITIGTGDGSAAVNVIKRELPDANIAYLEAVQGYQTVAQGKIDAYIFERLPMEKAMDHGLEGVRLLDENMEEQLNIAVGISPNCKIPDFENKLNSFIKSIKEDGTLDDMYNRWVNEENENMPFIEPPSNPKYHLVIGTTGVVQPYSYYKGNELCGLDIELGYRFAKYLDADVTFKVYDYSGIIPACATGNIDCIMANLHITPERAQSIPFSDVLFTQPIAIMVKDTTNVKTGITDYIADGFYKTFIKESRWKLLVQGLLTTVLITLFSIIFGTVLGFVTYLLCKDGNKIANGIYKVFSTLIQGMPVVVLLMILYYVVFGTLSLSATIVSIVGFTLVFAIGVHGLLVTGSKSIDIGQYEAAYALGHSRLSTFFTIILPQIIPLMIESYMGEIIALIKATAVVGYIAVIDLTKVGDIIRNRTYEAFFPLIAAAILYFVLEGIVILIISRVKTRVTPKMRKNRRLLKGVKLHD